MFQLAFFIFMPMLDFFLTLDEELLLFFNGLHSPWLDSVMISLTNGKAWLPLFLFTVIFILIKYKYRGLYALLLVGLVITLGDQISSSLLKPLIGRLRPSHEPHLEGILHIVNNYRGGLFSFVSSHATNSFGVATILWLLIGKQYKWIMVFFGWAVIFSFTRIYLGVHYPADVLFGALLGVSIAFGVYWATRKYLPNILP
ncbi:putative membrane-associated phospholipid phosphatase [hydrothermal vent metagenome]|uniref:Putative membrane-associated phospholipid phosphatase n=1 Tax=hydrothermal vent metagenome TaxID=652676 RepID=A0A3B0VCL0_9ZZZZ